jgi:hypothetical protein
MNNSDKIKLVQGRIDLNRLKLSEHNRILIEEQASLQEGDSEVISLMISIIEKEIDILTTLKESLSN